MIPFRFLARIPLQAAVLLLFVAAQVLPASAANAADTQPKRLLTVSGEGEMTAAPDEAQLSAGVVSESRTAAAALATNTEKMNAVFATLKKTGIPDKAIQTSGFDVSPQYPPYDSKGPRHIIGYQVSNTVTVKVNDLAKLGTALDALVNSGANQVNAVSFSIHDPKPLLVRARGEAVKDAMAKAETYAKAAGVTLGPILSISEGGGGMPPPVPMRVMALDASAPPPMAPGEQTVSASVTIAWEIE